MPCKQVENGWRWTRTIKLEPLFHPRIRNPAALLPLSLPVIRGVEARTGYFPSLAHSRCMSRRCRHAITCTFLVTATTDMSKIERVTTVAFLGVVYISHSSMHFRTRLHFPRSLEKKLCPILLLPPLSRSGGADRPGRLCKVLRRWISSSDRTGAAAVQYRAKAVGSG